MMERPIQHPLIRRNGESGSSLIEFALVLWFWCMLFIGTVALGLNLTRTLQVIQTARDLGHMYAKGADFSSAGYTNLLTGGGTPPSASLVSGMTLTAGGNAVVIFSQVRHIYTGDGDCTPSCTNGGFDVFLNQIIIGNTSLRSSVLGNPDPADLVVSPANGNTINPTTHLADRTSQFQLIPPTGTYTGMGSQAAAYVVEIYMAQPAVPFTGPFAGLPAVGATNTGNYTRVVF
jgi:hypothetical protein